MVLCAWFGHKSQLEMLKHGCSFFFILVLCDPLSAVVNCAAVMSFCGRIKQSVSVPNIGIPHAMDDGLSSLQIHYVHKGFGNEHIQ
jgi:hypothetical protein